jgi:hypothetical protein
MTPGSMETAFKPSLFDPFPRQLMIPKTFIDRSLRVKIKKID